MELLPLIRLERREERLLDIARDRPELCKLLLARRLQADEMAAAIRGIAAPLDQAGFLELVEETDEPAAVIAEGVGDRRLRLARALLEDGEHGVVVGTLARSLEGRERAVLDRP